MILFSTNSFEHMSKSFKESIHIQYSDSLKCVYAITINSKIFKKSTHIIEFIPDFHPFLCELALGLSALILPQIYILFI